MAKLFATDSDIWSSILQAWNDTDFYETVSRAYDMTDEINAILTGNGFAGIPKPEVTAVSELRIKYRLFLAFCEKIHQKAEAEIDEPFYYATSKAAGEAHRINPTEITVGAVSAGGRDLSVLQLISMAVGLDKELKAAFDTAVTTIKKHEPSKDLQKMILEAFMRKYAGVVDSSLIPQADIDLMMHYYQMQYPKDVHGLQNILNFLSITGVYNSEMDVINAIAGEMRSRTDALNLEHSVTITVVSLFGKDYYIASGIVAGDRGNVVPAAVLGSPLIGNIVSYISTKTFSPFSNKILIHTHPNDGWSGDNLFSGNPGNLSVPGDVIVPVVLRYQSIYLIAPNGNLYNYAGYGNVDGINANNQKELLELVDKPLIENLAPSEIKYILNPNTGKYEIPVYDPDKGVGIP